MAYKHYMLLLALSTVGISGMEISQQVFKDRDLSDVRLMFNNGKFYTLANQEKHRIQPVFIDKEIRNISEPRLKQLLASDCYLMLRKLHDSQSLRPDYALRLNGRIRGGGPWFAAATFLTGSLLTGAGAVATFITLLPNPPAAIAGAAAVAKGGMTATGYATVYAAGAPTP